MAGKLVKICLCACGAAFLVVAGIGGYWFSKNAAASESGQENAGVPAALPFFVVLEPFTVNLKAEWGEQYLATAFSLQVSDQAQQDLFKTHMPTVRNRMLLLLSGKTVDEISSVEGKRKLMDEALVEMNRSFMPADPPQRASAVLITSFVFQ